MTADHALLQARSCGLLVASIATAPSTTSISTSCCERRNQIHSHRTTVKDQIETSDLDLFPCQHSLQIDYIYKIADDIVLGSVVISA